MEQVSAQKLWSNCLKVFQDNVTEAAFKTWFLPIVPLSYENRVFTIQVPSQFFYEYLEDKFIDLLKATLYREIGSDTILQYRILMENTTNTLVDYRGDAKSSTDKIVLGKNTNKVPNPFQKVVADDFDSQLNNKYTFDNFFEGESNKLARTAGETITRNPGKTAFNPLFVHGTSGVGKTHLCHAIGNSIKEQYPEKRVLYVSAHLFKVQYADAGRYNTTNDFIHSNIWSDFHDMFILLKGARSFSFESINKLLEVKTHETVLDIDLDAIVHNYNFYRSRLNPKTKMVCMVKADGYGTGATEVAKTLQYHKCDYLAVAVAEEGVFLRKQGIKVPIIVLNSEVGGFEELAMYALEPEVYNFRILDAFIKEAKLQGITNYPIHIKIDTGMHRLGFTEEDIPELMERIKSQTGVRIQSVFSHLAASESWNFDNFTIDQIKTFKKITKEIEKNCHYQVMKHILNSAGIERFPNEQMDMVRLGISLYGVSASGLNGLRNVCTLKTTILQIKYIKAGETVGYGRKGHFDKDATIATIRIGYADGLSRQFGNGVGKVLVNGHMVPIVGNICMDLSMIDVTGVDVKEGDSVVIFGENPSVVDLAKEINTIPYEILTSISSRVKHIYYKE